MRVANVHRMIVIATPEELRGVADTLEKEGKETLEKYPNSTFYTSIFGDNGDRIDFYIDVNAMGDAMGDAIKEAIDDETVQQVIKEGADDGGSRGPDEKPNP